MMKHETIFDSGRPADLQTMDRPPSDRQPRQDDPIGPLRNPRNAVDEDSEKPSDEQSDEITAPREYPETDEASDQMDRDVGTSDVATDELSPETDEMSPDTEDRAERFWHLMSARDVHLPREIRLADIPSDVLDGLISAMSEESIDENGALPSSLAKKPPIAPEESPFVAAAEAALGPAETDLPVGEDDGPGPETEERSDTRQCQFRNELAERIGRSQRLPNGLRQRLASIVETVQLDSDGNEEPTLRVSDAVSMIEQSMPRHVQIETEQLQQPRHPGGEVFFSGDPGDLSDEEAERIAREQLASSGFAPRRDRSQAT